MHDDQQEAVPEAVADWIERRSQGLRRAEPLAGDLGSRRYLRLHLEGRESVVLALYPAGDEGCARFYRTHRILRAGEVATPDVLGHDADAGWMLLEDVGPTWYETPDRPPWPAAEPWYRRAIETALAIRALPRAAVAALNPPLEPAALQRELRITWELFLVPEGLTGPPALAARLDTALATLCRRLGAETLVPAHRDFMVRNLVWRGENPMVVLDHQDLRLAPSTYDLASLLNDSLFPPAAAARELALSALGCEPSAYRRAVVQRCLKAVGSFRRAAARGQDARTALVRPTLARAWAEFEHLPELAPLREPLAERWEAAISGPPD